MNTQHKADTPNLSTAMNEFFGNFRHFCKNMQQRLEQQEQGLQDMQIKQARPGLTASGQDLGDRQHQQAFQEYLRKGDDNLLRDLSFKAMSAGVDSEGGYLVSPQVSQSIHAVLAERSSMRQIASVAQTRSNSLEFLVDKASYGASWVAETDPRPETASSVFEKITIPVYELAAMPKATQRLLDDNAFDLEGWIAGRVAEKFALIENSSFLSGDGSIQPYGFLSKTMVTHNAWEWGKLGYTPTGVADDLGANPLDSLIDVIYALPANYRPGAVFLMNSRIAARLRQLKDGDGRYLWTDPINNGGTQNHAMLLGYPVILDESMPDVGAGANIIAFGNFRQGYLIVDGHDIRTLRDPFSAKPHVLFYTTRRVGGDVVDYNAIKILRCSV